jgi:hypothetical protein
MIATLLRDFVVNGTATGLALNRKISMAIADPAHFADGAYELAKPLRLRIRPKSLAPKLLTVGVVACAAALAGCARNPAQQELKPVQREVRVAPVRLPARPRLYATAPRHAEPRVRRPDPALLEPQSAPNCEFKRADIKAVDPDEWARLRTEYERQCYQDAERAVRDRLSELQAAVR